MRASFSMRGRKRASVAAIAAFIRYRTDKSALFQTVAAPTYASTLGGSAYTADIWGPTHVYVDSISGWKWTNPGGDWIDSALAANGSSAWGSTSTPTGTAGVVYDHSFDVTAALQNIQVNGRWCAFKFRYAAAPRKMAGVLYGDTTKRPKIVVTYADSSSATLVCKLAANDSAGSSLPASAYAEMNLPCFLEFERPTKAVSSATFYFSLTEQQWSGSPTTVELVGILTPPLNSEPTTYGVSSAAGPLDKGIMGLPGVLGSHRYVDGTTLTDFVVVDTAKSGSSESNYDPYIWDPVGNPTPDTSKWPHTVAGKWLKHASMSSLGSNPTLVDSSYTGEGFIPVAPGVGALKVTLADAGLATGAEGSNIGTLASDMFLMFAEKDFGNVDHLFVRYCYFIGTPSARTPADRTEVLQSGSPAWTAMAGKDGIGPCHTTTYGGVSGTSGGGYGWQMRHGWYECEANQGGPDEDGQSMGFHVTADYKTNNPTGYQYGNGADAGAWANQDEQWGQQGGLGGYIYAGRWYDIETELKLNTVTPPSSWSADGELRCWIDGRLVYEKTGLVFRTLPIYSPSYDGSKIRAVRTLGVKQLWLNFFHGGQTQSSVERTRFYTALAWGKTRIGPFKTDTTVPSWVPAAGSATSIGYASGTHPSGLDATEADASPEFQSWNPLASDGYAGPWSALSPPAPSRYLWTTNAYCGACWSPVERKIIFMGRGHVSASVPAPYAFDVSTLAWEWLAVPPPTDNLSQVPANTLGKDTAAAAYPSTQFDPEWGEWNGSYSGWQSGFARPGKIFPEPGHSYFNIVWIPGYAHGNTKGAMMNISDPTGFHNGSGFSTQFMMTGHVFDMDTRSFVRTTNKRYPRGAVAGGCCFHPGVDKVFAITSVSSTVTGVLDVYTPGTKTWAVTNATASIDVPIESGGLQPWYSTVIPKGLLLFFCPETTGGAATYNGTRHRIYAVDASLAAAGSHTWSTLTVSATSWPLAVNGTIATIGWCFCPVNSCYYAINGQDGSTTLWKLTPPSATTVAGLLSGTWNITTETLSAGIVSKSVAGTGSASNIYNRMVWDGVSGCLLYVGEYIHSRVQAIRPAGL